MWRNWDFLFLDYKFTRVCVCVCVCLCALSHVWLFATPWPGCSAHGIFQAKILEWIVIFISRGSSQGLNPCLLHWQAILYLGSPKIPHAVGQLRPCAVTKEAPHVPQWKPHMLQLRSDAAKPIVFVVQLLSHVHLFVMPWTAAHQTSLSFTVSWSKRNKY